MNYHHLVDHTVDHTADTPGLKTSSINRRGIKYVCTTEFSLTIDYYSTLKPHTDKQLLKYFPGHLKSQGPGVETERG